MPTSQRKNALPLLRTYTATSIVGATGYSVRDLYFVARREEDRSVAPVTFINCVIKIGPFSRHTPRKTGSAT